MTVTIRPEHEQLISKVLETGAYESPDEVVGALLEVLREDEEWLAANKAAINDKIDRATGQLDRGEGIPGDELRGRLDMLKVSWRASQRRL